jgi:hypothetical protein
MLEAYEIESASKSMYERAGVDPAREPGAIRLAEALGLRVELVPGLGARARIVGKRIDLRAEMTLAGLEYSTGHELGHDYLADPECADPRVEHICNSISVAIIAPEAAMFRMRMVFGWQRIPRIACTLGTSDLIVALRWGTVMEEPVAVVLDRGGVRRSGPMMGADDRMLRAIARSGGGDGLRAVRVARGVMLIGPT